MSAIKSSFLACSLFFLVSSEHFPAKLFNVLPIRRFENMSSAKALWTGRDLIPGCESTLANLLLLLVLDDV